MSVEAVRRACASGRPPHVRGTARDLPTTISSLRERAAASAAGLRDRLPKLLRSSIGGRDALHGFFMHAQVAAEELQAIGVLAPVELTAPLTFAPEGRAFCAPQALLVRLSE
jgi:hypothetical protein